MEGSKKIDKRDKLKVVTSNELIDAGDLSKLSLNARKLFYVAVAQCKREDREFYEYETTPGELAELWGLDRSNVYREAGNICRELMQIVLTLHRGQKAFTMYHLFEVCDYDDDSRVVFKISSGMSDLLLGLKGSFTQPLLWDFMKMRSPYSMAIWHLMQREMKSFKPMMAAPIQFDLTLEELRRVTGTEKKFNQVGQFKQYVLDKAIKEIRKNCFCRVSYTNIKRGRAVTGFRFTAESYWGTMDETGLSYRMRQQLRRHDLVMKRKAGTITAEETEELLDLTEELEQITIEDVENGYPED